MKNTIILFAIFCLPMLSHAYELEPIYADMAKDLNAAITANINANYNTNQSDEKLYKKVIAILDNHKAAHHTYSFSNDKNTTSNFACYLVEDIKKEIQNEGLTEQLKNSPYTLNEIANHILSYGYENKFETLLAIGINPIEAGLRLEHGKGRQYGKYVEEALEKGQITYQHYILKNSTTAIITEEVIYVNTTEEEVEKILHNLIKMNSLQRPKWLEEIIGSSKQELRKIKKDLIDLL